MKIVPNIFLFRSVLKSISLFNFGAPKRHGVKISSPFKLFRYHEDESETESGREESEKEPAEVPTVKGAQERHQTVSEEQTRRSSEHTCTNRKNK